MKMKAKRIAACLLTMMLTATSVLPTSASVYAKENTNSVTEKTEENDAFGTEATKNPKESEISDEENTVEMQSAAEERAKAEAESISEDADVATLQPKEEAEVIGAASAIVYDFDVKWGNAVSDSVSDYRYDDATDPNHNNLIFKPMNQEIKVATLNYQLAIDNDANMVLPAGSIKITVPDYLFEAWGDKYQVNRENENIISSTVRWQIPKAPATSTVSDFNYKDNGDGTYTVTNFNPVAGGSKLSFEQAFPFKPHYIRVDSNGTQKRNLAIGLTIDYNLDGAPEVVDNKALSSEIHNQTGAMTVDLKKDHLTSNNGVFFDWQDAWGDKPQDAKDYFYVVWYADAKHTSNNTIPFDYKVVQEASDGELIGAKFASGYATEYGFLWPTYLDGYTDRSYSKITKDGALNLLNQPGLYSTYNSNFATHTLNGFLYDNWNMARFSLLKRYPVSMLEEAKKKGIDLAKDGLPITNKVTVKTVLANGVEYTNTDEETQNIHVYPYEGVNQIWKYDAVNTGTGLTTMVGVKSYLLDGKDKDLIKGEGYKTFTTHVEGSSLTEPNFDEVSGDYKAKPYTAEIEEGGYYDSSYLQREGYYGEQKEKMTRYEDADVTYKSVAFSVNSYHAKKSSIGGWTLNTNADDSQARSQAIEIYTRKTNETTFSLYGKVSFDEKGNYSFVSEDGKVSIDNAKGKDIPLPAKTSGLKYKYTSAYYKYDFYATTVMEMHPTENVKKILNKHTEDKKSSLVSTDAKVSFSQEGGLKRTANTEGQIVSLSSVYLGTISPSFGNDKSQGALVDDVNTGKQTRDVNIYFRQYSSLWDSGNKDREYLSKYVYKEGNIYDLLPAGVEVPSASIAMEVGPYWGTKHLSYGDDYQVEMIANWEDSGQTMMKIHFKVPDEKADVSTFNNHGYSIKLSYKMSNSYNNIVDRGNSLVNTAALEILSREENLVLQSEADNKKAFDRLARKSLFENLTKNDFKYWRFAEGTIGYNPVTVTQSGIVKEVANEHDNLYADSTDAFVGNNYSYRLAYSTATNTRSDELVFYDILEDGSHKENSEWRGTLDWVDVTSIDAKPAYGHAGDTAKPVVYYATKVPSKLNVDDASIWSATMPQDKSSIKAIAVDCRKTDKGESFVLDQGMGLNLFIHMKAPADLSLDGKTAVNQTISYARNFTGTKALAGTLPKEYEASAKITLHAVDLELHKSSNPETGTKDALAEISSEEGTPLSYSLTIKNHSSELDTRKIHLEDVIPEHLLIDKDAILVTSKALNFNENLLKDAAGIGLTRDGQKLEILIESLPANGEITFTIPTKLDKGIIKETHFVNTAKITEAEGLKQNITSETTYHKANKLYSLSYVVFEDETYGLPSDSKTPKKVENIEYNTNETLAAALTTKDTKALDGTYGRWEFIGWSESKDSDTTISTKNIRKDEVVYGQWEFTPTRDIAVTKVWKEFDGSDLKAPVSKLEIELLQDGKVITKKDLLATDRWMTSFVGLDKINPQTGKDYDYTVREAGLDKDGQIKLSGAWYSSSGGGDVVNGYTITNTRVRSWETMIPATTSLTVTKSWKGLSAKNIEKESLSIKLFKNGVATDQVKILSKENGFKATFENLKVTDAVDGTSAKNTYSVKEIDATGNPIDEGGNISLNGKVYTVHYDGNTITNTLVNPKINLSGIKLWEDADDQDGKRPKEVTIHLYANGKLTDKSVKATEESEWKYSFNDLETFDKNGDVIEYSVKEDLPEGYTDRVDGTTITNTHIPEQINIPVQKLWVDNDDAKKLRPESVHINLYANGEKTASYDLVSSEEWKHTFENLPKYKDGKVIEYEVKEDAIEHYSAVYAGEAKTVFTITNTIEGKVSIPVTKKWIGKEADSVTIHLLADGQEADSVTLTAESGWQHIFQDLEQYKGGKEIIYSIREDAVEGYASEVTKDADSYLVTNTNMKTRDIKVRKEWNVKTGDHAEISLYRDDREIEKISITKAEGWKHVFEDLEVYDKTDGHEYKYSVQETKIPGYVTEIRKDQQEEFVVTNTYAPEMVAVDVPVRKVLEGNPKAASTFTFRMKALEKETPMPEGSKDGIKTATITGSGLSGFGNIEFKLPGSYRYEITEINDKVKNYQYDTSVYTLTVNVEDVNGKLLAKTGIEKAGKTEKELVFTNRYKETKTFLSRPKTGDSSHILLYIGAILLSLVVISMKVLAKRKYAKK